ncbi:DMT family transporter [Reinekea sp.]|uniref:DMT family transporter n=1 Tax=Reinekea sp. TaxID=1970455 RepID=UPI00398993FF
MTTQKATSMQAPDLLAYVLLFAQGAIFGSSFFIIKVALEDFGPITVAAGRIALGALMMVAYALYKGERFPRDSKVLMWLALVGLTNCAIPFFLIPWGEQHLESGQAAILMAIGPLIAHFTTTDERMNRFKAAGFLLGFIGVLFVIGIQPVVSGIGGLLPQLAILMAATSYAVAGAFAKHIHGISSVMMTACVLTFASIMTVPISFMLESPIEAALQSHSNKALLALVWLGIVPTGFTFLIRFFLIKKAGYTFVSQVGYLVPIFGVLFGMVMLNEVITLTMLGGMALILTGLAISRITKHY